MTLEEIRAMAACNPQYFDHCHSCMLNTGEGSGRGKCSAEDDRGPLGQPALAALVVRLVEGLLVIRDAGGTTTEEGLSCSGSWCAEQAGALLRELEVEV